MNPSCGAAQHSNEMIVENSNRNPVSPGSVIIKGSTISQRVCGVNLLGFVFFPLAVCPVMDLFTDGRKHELMKEILYREELEKRIP